MLSVHSVVSFDFAMALTPGWHATIFPPYFVAGAIFSGLGMVFTIIIPIRKFFKLQHYVTLNDLDAAAKMCLFTSLVVGLAYLTEFQIAWMSGNKYEQEYFWVDYAILLGSFGWFFMWFLLFIKQLPVLAIAELKEVIPPKLRRPHPELYDHSRSEGVEDPSVTGEYDMTHGPDGKRGGRH